MKEINIEGLREIQLCILDYIDDICRKNNIKYSLNGGTLIGAVRHRGYVPWDDDVDIMMPRPEYDKLLKILKSNDSPYIVQDYYTDDAYTKCFAKVIDSRTVLQERIIKTGVFVDIFPIDGLPPLNEFDAYMNTYKSLRTQFLRTCKLYKQIHHPVKIFKQFVKLYIYPGRKTIIGKLENLFNSITFEEANFAGYIVGRSPYLEHFPKHVFEDYIYLKFEGKEYMCIKDYDTYLTKRYGDYMKLPPKEEQVSNHSFVAWWK